MTQDFMDKLPFTVEEATDKLLNLPITTRVLRMRLVECNGDLLELIASRFPDLRELMLLPKYYGHPFGDIVITSDDLTVETTNTSTAKALATAVGKIVGSRYATILSSLHSLEDLSLGVSLYGPYGTVSGADEEPEMADVETSMNLVASDRIAQALPSLQRITWQNVTPDGDATVRLDDEDDEVVGNYVARGLTLAVIRDGDGKFVRVQATDG
ncbi:hypothetical protein EIP86_008547 [Pleurotus ostreatoroseus]|nr:hypothetical protein EIP86_008547 [Pleurotus ostreatoroseus]